MKNETKLKRLIQWLEENKIQYVLPTKKQKGSSDLFVVEYLISVKIESDDDKLFFNKHKRGRHPFFIRSSETPKFIIEKMQNLIISVMLAQQEQYMEQNKRNPQK